MSADIRLTEYGPMSSSLKCSSLSELCVDKVGVQTGPFGSQLHKEDYVEVGTPIITVEHLGDNRIFHVDTPFVSDEDKARLSKYHLAEGDIVFSRVGSVDRRALVRKEEDGWLFSGRCLRVRVDKTKIDPVYLSYFFGLEGFKNYIRNIAVGATMPSINTKILSDVPIYYPECLEEQRKIANIFYTSDEKIELNRQTNQTLEAIAQAIFKSWFVDFDPVKAKIAAKEAGQNPQRAAMAAIAGKSIEQLDTLPAETIKQLQTTADLFPDALVDSDLGEIPEGWEVDTVKGLVELSYGKALKKIDRVEGEFPVYGSGGGAGTHNKFHVEGPGIIVGRKGTVGSLYWSDQSFFPIDTVFYVQCKGEVTLEYVYYLLQTLGLENMNTDAAVPGLNRNNVYRLEVPRVPNELIKAFSVFTKTLRKKISNAQAETNSLEQLRDTLLPKLLSGGLGLSEQEKAVVNG